MALADVESEILAPMQRLYLPPRNMDEGAQREALREYGDALQSFDRPDLQGAWKATRDAHTNRSWPLVSQFIKAAREYRRDRNDAGGAALVDGKKAETEWDTWVRVCRTQMARDAVRNGVAWSLKCAILHDKKRPEEIDMREMVSAKASAERTAERIRKGQPHEWKGANIGVFSNGHAATALKMLAAIQQRETETAQEINYGAAA
jgi:hypothetical protein